MPPVAARLPTLEKQPWMGYYAVFSNRHFRFGMSAHGKLILVPLDEQGEPVPKTLVVPVEITVEEILPTGKTIVKQLKPETLQAAQPATDKLARVVIRGKVTGDASFELTLEQNRGLISLGGRLLDPGSLSNPLRFSIRLKFPAAYSKNKTFDKKESKAFENKIAGDHLDLKWTDGKRKKQSFDNAVDATAKELNGPGIATAEIEISAYQGKKFLLGNSGNSRMTLSNNKSAPLHEGFAIHWWPDPAKDPEGAARLSLEVR